jgi:hypothetical protein
VYPVVSSDCTYRLGIIANEGKVFVQIIFPAGSCLLLWTTTLYNHRSGTIHMIVHTKDMSPSHCCPTLVHPLPLWGRCGRGDMVYCLAQATCSAPFCGIQPPNTSMICLIKEHSLLDTLPEDRTHYGMIIALANIPVRCYGTILLRLCFEEYKIHL